MRPAVILPAATQSTAVGGAACSSLRPGCAVLAGAARCVGALAPSICLNCSQGMSVNSFMEATQVEEGLELVATTVSRCCCHVAWAAACVGGRAGWVGEWKAGGPTGTRACIRGRTGGSPGAAAVLLYAERRRSEGSGIEQGQRTHRQRLTSLPASVYFLPKSWVHTLNR